MATYDEESDIALVAALRRGDPQSLGTLYDRHAPAAYALCVRLLKEQLAAEEALEAVFEFIWQRRSQVRVSNGGLGAFILSLVRCIAAKRQDSTEECRSLPARPDVEARVSSSQPITLDDVLCTHLLNQRVSPPADVESENAALYAIANELANNPQATLEVLVQVALKLCGAGSAGVSLLEPRKDGSAVFRWVALAGEYSQHLGGTTPADFSPCGTTLARGAPQLFSHPERFFVYFQEARPLIVEGLVVPLRAGEVVGTLWTVSHSEETRFTQEDVRVTTSLAGFTAAAIAVQHSRLRAEQNEHALTAANESLRARIAGRGSSQDRP